MICWAVCERKREGGLWRDLRSRRSVNELDYRMA